MRKVPKLILKYGKKVKSLGKGTYGEVNLHSKGGKMYAIKTSFTKKNDCTYPQDFLTEIICFSRCNHKNVVKMVDFFCDFSQKKKDYFYIVMEVGIENLRSYEPESDKEIKKISLQILCGLQHISNRGIVTGDIKFENIIVFDNKFSISDFGLSQINPGIKSADYLIEKIYTLYYRPLEALLDRKCSNKSDIWAFGVMLGELMTGKLPFDIPELDFGSENDSGKKDKMEEDAKIEKLLSYASPKDIEYLSKLSNWDAKWQEIWGKKYESNEIENLVHSDNELLNDLLIKMLRLIPEERITISECFEHDFFSKYRSEYKCEFETPKEIREILSDYEAVLTIRNDNLSKYIIDSVKNKNIKKIIKKCELSPRIISIAISFADRFPEEKESELIFIICLNMVVLTANTEAPFFDVTKSLKGVYSNKKIMLKTFEMLKQIKGNIINTNYADYLDLISGNYSENIVRKAEELALSFYVHGYNYIYTSEEICNFSIQLSQEYYEEEPDILTNRLLEYEHKKNIYKTAKMTIDKY